MVLIADRVTVARRYVRAVDLVRDIADPAALDGYIITPSAHDALGRILRGIAASSTQRAFRVTGPYGCGKSSFGLLLARLFLEREVGGPAATLVRNAGIEAGGLPGYIPILLVGRRASLTDELLGCIQGLSGPGGALPDNALRGRAVELLEQRRAGIRDIAPVLDLLAEFAGRLADTGRGLLLLVDEMGRFIEYAAANPGAEDPAIFQQLAERCGGQNRGLAIVAFLHNRFADYVAGLGEWMEGEWARSAERYEELAFQEPAEQSLFLLAEALRAEPQHAPAVTKSAARLYGEAHERGLFNCSAAAIAGASKSLYPLHPAAVAALVACSRRLGQNERSTFSFLQSFEPAGLQRFMGDAPYNPEIWYRLDRLFDYLAAQGDVRFRSPDKERRWHLALDALALAADLGEEVRAALKGIALLSVLEPLAGLSADAATLGWCLGTGEAAAEAALSTLIGRGLVHRRSGRQDYSLWSSSSVDLEDWLEQARRAVPLAPRLDEALIAGLAARPLVAHRHYHETGHLRIFGVTIGEAAGAERADGWILIIPVYPDENMDARIGALRAASKRAGIMHLYNVRRILPADLAVANELALWNWIRENCPELRIDDLARGEVQRRIEAAQRALGSLLRPLSRPQDQGCWIHNGELVEIGERGALSRILSDSCRRHFHKAPILRNELINRDKLSTAIAAARSRLLEAMLAHPTKPFLGLEGAPPERTIFLSLFHASGLHREEQGSISFLAPPSADPLGWRPIWDYVGKLLAARGRMRFDELSDELARAPYGLRAGPSMLLIAAYLLANRRDIAVMERGSFQPELTGAHFMRLGKNAANFELRHIGDVEERQQLLEALVRRLSIWDEGKRPEASLKPIVRHLFKWFNALPEYTVGTNALPPLALEVRTVLRKAQEPIALLFVDLPRACDALDECGAIDTELFCERLDLACSALADAEPKLRRQAEAATLEAFAVANVAELRGQIRLDYGRHASKLQEYRLRSFVDRAMNEELDQVAWIDSIASLLAGRRLSSWDDQALDRFTFETRELAQRLARWLALARIDTANRLPVAGVHLTSSDGNERSVFIRRRGAAPGRAELLAQLRGLLRERDDADVILAELLAELPAKPRREEHDA
jgi:hypothetical protein